jgi:COMPASS component SWD2
VKFLQTKLKPAKVFKNVIEAAQPPPTLPNQPPKPPTPRSITGISFDDRGDTVVTAAEDEAFKLYSCKNGR